MSRRSAFDTEYEWRLAHVQSLPAWQLKEDLDALKRCVYVFNANANELAAHVGQFLRSSITSQQLPDEYVDELVRRLHNYLTAVTSLVDSQRVAMRHRWPTGRRTTEEICDSCQRPLPSRDALSEFESGVYTEKLSAIFETGEGAFMGKLRNYCTHYSILEPALGTTLTMRPGMPAAMLINTLQLGRDKLLRWNGWGAVAKAYLKEQPDYFDLVPIIERYVNAAGVFAAWFYDEITALSADLIDEVTSKVQELNLWKDECVGRPDWFEQGLHRPPPGWNGRLARARKREVRYRHGAKGFRLWAIDALGVVSIVRDDEWTPLPL